MSTPLIILTILLILIGNGYYVITVFRGQTKPHIYSWIIWAVVQSLACMIQFQNGANWWAITLWLNWVICTFVAILSIWYGEKNITRLDTLSLTLALCIIPLWLWAKQDFLAILIALSIDLISYIPTARKSYQKPHEEHLWTYYASSAAFLISMFLAQEKTVITLLYPFMIFWINFIFIAYIYWRRKIIK